VPWEFSFEKGGRFGRRGLVKETVDGRTLDEAPAVDDGQLELLPAVWCAA
jgi:hypothetical protein